jgi:hypothetical protein
MLEEPGKEFVDHIKDRLPFEIAVVNQANNALVI